jgi:Chitobiase/beta-hexosaminidase C-terminal domain
MISLDGRTFAGSVQVAIVDADAKAVVFYTTDGKRPTTSSTRYTGPIVVSAKTKVQALAFDLDEMPSGVVAKTFR